MTRLSIFLALLLATTVVSSDDYWISFSKGKIIVREDGKNAQLFIEKDGVEKRVTDFKPRESIGGLKLSPDERYLLFYHMPYRRQMARHSVVDMDSLKIIATTILKIPDQGGDSALR